MTISGQLFHGYIFGFGQRTQITHTLETAQRMTLGSETWSCALLLLLFLLLRIALKYLADADLSRVTSATTSVRSDARLPSGRTYLLLPVLSNDRRSQRLGSEYWFSALAGSVLLRVSRTRNGIGNENWQWSLKPTFGLTKKVFSGFIIAYLLKGFLFTIHSPALI